MFITITQCRKSAFVPLARLKQSVRCADSRKLATRSN